MRTGKPLGPVRRPSRFSSAWNRFSKRCLAAVKQAHERIIGERQVANDEKLLSLFEPDIHVIVRGKADAEVEFGNLLVLGEQSDGLIIDWELFKEEVPADVRLVRPSVERVESGLQLSLKSLVTDRGFDKKMNVKWLEERGTFAGLYSA